MVLLGSRAIALLSIVITTTSLWAQYAPPVAIQQTTPKPGYRLLQFADLNSDGNQDALVWREEVFGYMAGNGSNDLSDVTTIASTPTPYNVIEATIYDLDGDGHLDVTSIISHSTSYVVLTWLNDGSGTFSAPDTILTTSYSLRVAAGDIDGDGDGDLVVQSPNGTSYLYRNDGPGIWEVVPSATYVSSGLHIADIDNDGTYELIFTDLGTMKVGSFVNDAFEVSSPTPIGPFHFVEFMCDMNGDGFLDAVSTDYSNGTLRVTLNNGSSTTWSPAIEIIPNTGQVGTVRFAHADMDLDGDQDLLVRNDRFLLYENDGSGIQFTPREIPTQEEIDLGYYITDFQSDFFVVDLNGDALPDLALSFQQVPFELFVNAGNLTFSESLPVRPDALVQNYGDITFADTDGDGLTDLLFQQAYQRHTAIVRNLGNGQFADAVYVSNRSLGSPWEVSMADMDGDGSPDLITYLTHRRAMVWQKNLGANNFGPPNIVVISEGGGYLSNIADADADGDIDVVFFGNGPQDLLWLENDGSGVFSDEQPFVVITDPTIEDIRVDEINGDGRLDLSWWTPMGFYFQYALGNGAWSAPEQMLSSELIIPVDRLYVDMDGDGDNDMVGSNYFIWENGVKRLIWYENRGELGWSDFKLMCDLDVLSPVLSFGLRDADGDTDLDLFLLEGEEGAIQQRLIPRLGGSIFDIPIPLGAGIFSLAQPASVINTTAPYDILLYDTDGQLHYMANMGTATQQIRGRVYLDNDLSGTYSTGDQVVPQVVVGVSPSEQSTLAYDLGEFVLTLPAGSYVVGSPLEMDPAIWTSTGPASYEVELTDQVVTGIDFGYTPSQDVSNILITIVMGVGPCAGLIPANITIKNMGTRTESGSMTVDFDSLIVLTDVLPFTGTINGNAATWHFENLLPQHSLSFVARIQLPGVESIGASLSCTATVQPVDGQGVETTPFAETLEWMLDCAFDPNDKQVSPVGYGVIGAIEDSTEFLDYTIRFQNTGTAPAFHVRLVDQLSPDLDPTRIELIGASHTVGSLDVSESGELEVRFIFIMLPDSASDPAGSQGFVRFRIALKAGVEHLTSIQNTASIFFDLNDPVITNTTLNTLVDCDLWQPVITNPVPDLLEALEGDSYQWFLAGAPIVGGVERWLTIDAVGEYSVRVTNGYGCTTLSDPIVIITLDVAERKHEGLIALPNPFSSWTTLVSPFPMTADQTVVIRDVHGRIINSTVGNGSRRLEIPRSGLAVGLYLVQLISGDGSPQATLRLVVE